MLTEHYQRVATHKLQQGLDCVMGPCVAVGPYSKEMEHEGR